MEKNVGIQQDKEIGQLDGTNDFRTYTFHQFFHKSGLTIQLFMQEYQANFLRE